MQLVHHAVTLDLPGSSDLVTGAQCLFSLSVIMSISITYIIQIQGNGGDIGSYHASKNLNLKRLVLVLKVDTLSCQ